MNSWDCRMCGGTGERSTARSADGSELERHERSGTPCDVCHGSGKRPYYMSDLPGEMTEQVYFDEDSEENLRELVAHHPGEKMKMYAREELERRAPDGP